MSLGRVNVIDVELDETLEAAGFRHAAATVGDRLGAGRIGASVYEAVPERPIWPYHYHHGVEEWLYVIAGEPVLRDPSGTRSLAPGDLVCFPDGHAGAHTMTGPGRFAILATGHQAGVYMSVYPDSDKVSGPGGILLRGSAVGYWHGEGTGVPGEPPEIEREPAEGPPLPVANVFHDAGSIEGDRLAAEVADLRPGDAADALHYVHGREKWVLVVDGSPTLRHAEGETILEAGDLVCLPDGPAGAHQLLNRGEAVARTLSIWTTGLPANAHYPETGRWVLHHGGDEVIVQAPG